MEWHYGASFLFFFKYVIIIACHQGMLNRPSCYHAIILYTNWFSMNSKVNILQWMFHQYIYFNLVFRRVNQSELVNNRKCYIIFALDKAPVKLGIPRLKSKQTFLGGVSDCLPTIFIKLWVTYMYLICTQRQKYSEINSN